MNRQQFARMLKETLVLASSLKVGDVVYSISSHVEGEVVRFDEDGDPVIRNAEGDTPYIDSDSSVVLLFNSNDTIRVFLPTNSDKELLKSNESLSDIRGYVQVYVMCAQDRQRLFETHSDRVHLITELTILDDLPPVQKLKKKHRRTLGLVAGHYSSGEETKSFFNDFMTEMK